MRRTCEIKRLGSNFAAICIQGSNIFISHVPSDKPVLDKLLQWLHPMRDEVNIYFKAPPPPPKQLPLPWQLLLFWYQPPNYSKSLSVQFSGPKGKITYLPLSHEVINPSLTKR